MGVLPPMDPGGGEIYSKTRMCELTNADQFIRSDIKCRLRWIVENSEPTIGGRQVGDKIKLDGWLKGSVI